MRPSLRAFTESEKSTLANALQVAEQRFAENAFHMACLYVFGDTGYIARAGAWLRLARQFVRQRDETRALRRRLEI